MDRLWRINSRTGCPPDIVNEEDHNVEKHEIPDFRKWTIPKIDIKNVYKISWAEMLFILLTNIYIYIYIYSFKW